MFGSKNKENVETVEGMEVPVNASDDASVDSSDSKGKSWFGKGKKKPRAEYQAEIDELKLQLAASNNELAETKQKLGEWVGWAARRPRA